MRLVLDCVGPDWSDERSGCPGEGPNRESLLPSEKSRLGTSSPAFLLAATGERRSIKMTAPRGMGVVLSALSLFSGLAGSTRAAPPPPSSDPARASSPITTPLRALSTNPHYFTDGSGKAIYLTGSHTWNNFQDWGTNGAIQPLDFTAYVRMLVAHNHNFTLLWATELPTFHGLPTTASSPPDFTVAPQPWQRTGPGDASDGKSKFDLTKFNPAYFDRLRGRVQQLSAAGIYAGVYLFSGEWVLRFRSPGDGYPLSGSNNVNGIDDGGGTRSVTMTAPNAITAVQ